MQTIAERLKWARSQTELTQAELSKRAGLTSTHVGFIEQGRYPNIEMKTGRSIAAALGITPEWLMFGADPQPTKEMIVATVEATKAAS